MFVLILALQVGTALGQPIGQPIGRPVGQPVGQQGRLVSQSVVGAMRLCVYGAGRHAPSLSVGRGEPCPYRYHAPDVASATLPPFAILSGQSVVDGRLVCAYRYGGTQYRAVAHSGSQCPLTPEFAPQLTPVPPGQPQ